LNLSLEYVRSSSGSEFQNVGPATGKARRPNVCGDIAEPVEADVVEVMGTYQLRRYQKLCKHYSIQRKHLCEEKNAENVSRHPLLSLINYL